MFSAKGVKVEAESSYIVAVVESRAAAATARLSLNPGFVADFLKRVEGDNISIVISGRYLDDSVDFACGEFKYFLKPQVERGGEFLKDDSGEVVRDDKGKPVPPPTTNDAMRVTLSAKELLSAIEVIGTGSSDPYNSSMTFEACATHVVVTRELLEAIQQEL